jgi:TusE/DsrC/DsvC family sulfur relay protein
MQTNPYAIELRALKVNGREVLTDQEGYIQDMDDWSEDFAQALAEQEGLTLTDEHWEVVRYIRDYYCKHGVQAQVRSMIKHFRNRWGPETGTNHYLHELSQEAARRSREIGSPVYVRPRVSTEYRTRRVQCGHSDFRVMCHAAREKENGL